MTSADPSIEEIAIPADGQLLAATRYRSGCRAVRGTIIIAAAIGRVRQTYAQFAGFLCGCGWDVVTFDYRGIGGSSRAWGPAAAFCICDWGTKDLAATIDWVRGQQADGRILLIGHSIGGQIAALAPNHGALTALVAVSAQRGFWGHWPGSRKYAVYGFFRLYVPLLLRLRGFLPACWTGIEPLPAGVAREWARWGLAPEYTDAQGELLRSHYERFSTPILALSFSDDLCLAPKPAVDVLFSDYYRAAPVTRWHIEPGVLGLDRLGHSGFFDDARISQRLWPSIVEWAQSLDGRHVAASTAAASTAAAARSAVGRECLAAVALTSHITGPQ